MVLSLSRGVALLGSCVLAASLGAVPGDVQAVGSQPSAPNKAFTHPNVYKGQADMTDEEVVRFATLLPELRTWLRSCGEKVEPVVIKGKADFRYSEAVASWLAARGWDPARFFCVMGRSLAGVYLVTESGDVSSKGAPEMPKVSAKEKEIVSRHLGEILQSGSDQTPPPVARGTGK